MNRSRPILPGPDILSRVLDDELVLYDTAAGTVHFLNGTARLVWELCDGKHGRDEIAARLADHFEAPQERLEQDLDQLLETLGRKGLIRS